MSKIWLDITNTPQVHFLSAIYRSLERRGDFNCIITAREISETGKLLENQNEFPFDVIGEHYGRSYIKKVFGLAKRALSVFNSDIQYDISISCGSESAVWNAFVRRKKSITFGDNDLARQWTYGRFVDFAFFPDAIAKEKIIKQGISDQKLCMYPGNKEDLYMADFEPGTDFKSSLQIGRASCRGRGGSSQITGA